MIPTGCGPRRTASGTATRPSGMRALLDTLDPTDTVVHLHSWTKALSTSVVRAVRAGGFRLVTTLHDFLTVCPTGTLVQLRHRALLRTHAAVGGVHRVQLRLAQLRPQAVARRAPGGAGAGRRPAGRGRPFHRHLRGHRSQAARPAAARRPAAPRPQLHRGAAAPAGGRRRQRQRALRRPAVGRKGPAAARRLPATRRRPRRVRRRRRSAGGGAGRAARRR